MTADEAKREFRRRMDERGFPHTGMSHDAYLQASIDIMVEIMAEAVAALEKK